MSKKHKKFCTTLKYVEQFLNLASAVTGCISVSAFASLTGILIRSTSSAIALKICAINTRIKNHGSMIKKNKKKHDKIVLWAKSKSNSIKVLISKALIDSVISHNEFTIKNNAQNE